MLRQILWKSVTGKQRNGEMFWKTVTNDQCFFLKIYRLYFAEDALQIIMTKGVVGHPGRASA